MNNQNPPEFQDVIEYLANVVKVYATSNHPKYKEAYRALSALNGAFYDYEFLKDYYLNKNYGGGK